MNTKIIIKVLIIVLLALFFISISKGFCQKNGGTLFVGTDALTDGFILSPTNYNQFAVFKMITQNDSLLSADHLKINLICEDGKTITLEMERKLNEGYILFLNKNGETLSSIGNRLKDENIVAALFYSQFPYKQNKLYEAQNPSCYREFFRNLKF